jgi:site-specific DNA recombinase
VVKELERPGWTNKRWVTRAGQRGGEGFTKTSLHRLLTHVAYAGKVRYKVEVHDGEHPAIVDPTVRHKAQGLLRRHGVTGGAPVRNRFGALLKGIIRCAPAAAP